MWSFSLANECFFQWPDLNVKAQTEQVLYAFKALCLEQPKNTSNTLKVIVTSSLSADWDQQEKPCFTCFKVRVQASSSALGFQIAPQRSTRILIRHMLLSYIPFRRLTSSCSGLEVVLGVGIKTWRIRGPEVHGLGSCLCVSLARVHHYHHFTSFNGFTHQQVTNIERSVMEWRLNSQAPTQEEEEEEEEYHSITVNV